ncbi:phosphoglycerate kinase [Geoglobus ahangari]|uniref:Phosphoglycerate kinase n=1 Tax=Geoglobus ahangari TaxID=113653 RepID=A0A0F7DBI3_9EURY|nr:phosphoglycerate kinase [Geoglobus ahangari]AKG91141.1 phosphoglycerate kinase [Geoglobus ahangari]
MIDGYPTLDDVSFSGKRVLMRIDINAPIVESEILDTTRFRSHVPTIEELEDCRLVLLAHQSRPGKKDFTSLSKHAEVLSRLLDRDVEYVDELFSSCAIRKIEEMEEGDIILLENVRFYSEEELKKSPEEHARSHMVSKLSRHFDLYVNDAFSASHRAHASLVGFPVVLPAVVGRLVEKEITALSTALRSDGRKAFVLGGAKISDSVKVMKNVLENGIAEKVYLTGVVANYFLMLSGVKLGEKNEKVVEDNKEGLSDEEMRELLERYRDRIVLPVDFGVESEEGRVDLSIEEFERLDEKPPIKDIGRETVRMFSHEIEQYDVAVINGPAGVFEEEEFAYGTFEILKAVSRAGFSVVGGGHISSAARLAGLDERMDHISTGGGASIRFLSGEKLPALEVIKKYWREKWSHFHLL